MGIPARKPVGTSSAAMGVCPVCRSRQRVLMANGKIAKHGRTAAAPSGCAGSYEPPYREDRRPGDGGGTVVGFRAGDSGAAAQGGPVVRSALPPPPAAS